jgi:hypothetical protein
VLRRGHHPEAETAGKAERGEEADEDGGGCGVTPECVSRSTQNQRRLSKETSLILMQRRPAFNTNGVCSVSVKVFTKLCQSSVAMPKRLSFSFNFCAVFKMRHNLLGSAMKGINKPHLIRFFSIYVQKSLSGITVNRYWGKNHRAFTEQLKKDVALNFHPLGCDTIKSVFDHELEHRLDTLLHISEDETIIKLYAGKTHDELTKELSRYTPLGIKISLSTKRKNV